MKSFIHRFALVLLLVGCSDPKTTQTISLPAPEGTTTSGGGGPYVLEFKDIGRTVVRRWKARGIKEIAAVAVEEFEQVLESADVKTTEEILKKDGEPVDALHFPSEQRILLSLVRWAPDMDFSQKQRLVVHEVLGLMGKEESKTYNKTEELLAAIGLFEEIDVNEFQVGADVAKTLVEKMPWELKEITVVEEGTSLRTTHYSARSDPNHFVSCRKHENLVPTYMYTHYFCVIGGQSFVSDRGTIRVQLNMDHPLWRLFEKDDYAEYGVVFDYGVVRGRYEGLFSTVEMFP